MTLQTIAQNVLKKNKASEVPTTIAGNTNNTAELVYQAIRDATKLITSQHSWQRLQGFYNFNTVIDQNNYALPSDMDSNWFLTDTFWNATTQRPVSGPLTPQVWQQINNLNVVSTTIFQQFIIIGNEMLIFPTPSEVDSLNYIYVKNTPVYSSLNTAQTDWLADDDYSILDEYLIELQASWMYLKQLQRPYNEEKDKADQYLQKSIGKDQGRATVRLNLKQLQADYPMPSWLLPIQGVNNNN